LFNDGLDSFSSPKILLVIAFDCSMFIHLLSFLLSRIDSIGMFFVVAPGFGRGRGDDDDRDNNGTAVTETTTNVRRGRITDNDWLVRRRDTSIEISGPTETAQLLCSVWLYRNNSNVYGRYSSHP
jgi:hypothetical protein